MRVKGLSTQASAAAGRTNAWIARNFRDLLFERCRDDIEVHCVSEKQTPVTGLSRRDLWEPGGERSPRPPDVRPPP
jgi:hypothetical protein